MKHDSNLQEMNILIYIDLKISYKVILELQNNKSWLIK